MKLYHGSTVEVKNPNISKGRANTDFGKGLYATTSFEQAQRWAHIRQNRDNTPKAIVSVYEFDENVLNDLNLNIRRFTGVDRDWLHFIVGCRKQKITHGFDIVMGPVANDRLYFTINMYENGELTEEAAIIQLKAYLLYDQLSFHTSKAIGLIKFVEAVEV